MEEEEEAMVRICGTSAREERRDDADNDDNDDVVEKKVRRGDMVFSRSPIYIHGVLYIYTRTRNASLETRSHELRGSARSGAGNDYQ